MKNQTIIGEKNTSLNNNKRQSKLNMEHLSRYQTALKSYHPQLNNQCIQIQKQATEMHLSLQKQQQQFSQYFFEPIQQQYQTMYPEQISKKYHEYINYYIQQQQHIAQQQEFWYNKLSEQNNDQKQSQQQQKNKSQEVQQLGIYNSNLKYVYSKKEQNIQHEKLELQTLDNQIVQQQQREQQQYQKQQIFSDQKQTGINTIQQQQDSEVIFQSDIFQGGISQQQQSEYFNNNHDQSNEEKIKKQICELKEQKISDYFNNDKKLRQILQRHKTEMMTQKVNLKKRSNQKINKKLYDISQNYQRKKVKRDNTQSRQNQADLQQENQDYFVQEKQKLKLENVPKVSILFCDYDDCGKAFRGRKELLKHQSSQHKLNPDDKQQI